jgi:riboflavin kinase/FMN adenylyltransferase
MHVIPLHPCSSQTQSPGRAIALGNFDGLHLGHQRVIQSTFTCPATPSVLSFSPHPQEFFTGQPRPLLTPLAEKIALLTQLGVAELVVLPFNRQLAELTAAEFMDEILRKRLGATYVSVGHNFRFGRGRQGTTADLAALWGDRLTVLPEQLLPHSTTRFSSSRVREALGQGDVALAREILGRPYTLTGPVIHGQHLGRTIGIPTANLSLDPHKFLPRRGVYGVQVQYQSQRLLGVMNIGCRPTVTAGDPRAAAVHAEVHLLDWQGDLYGRLLTVSLMAFLRPEQTFASLAQLREQIHQDCDRARQLCLSAPATADSRGDRGCG